MTMNIMLRSESEGNEKDEAQKRSALTDGQVEEAALLPLQSGQFAPCRQLCLGVLQVQALANRQLVEFPLRSGSLWLQVGAVLDDERDAEAVSDGEGSLLFERTDIVGAGAR